MISQKLSEKILLTALSSGADFAEIYIQNSHSNNIIFLDGKVESINDILLSGAGIRIFKGTKTIYASTTNLTEDGLQECARNVAAALGDVINTAQNNLVLYERVFPNSHYVGRNPSLAPMKNKNRYFEVCLLCSKEL